MELKTRYCLLCGKAHVIRSAFCSPRCTKLYCGAKVDDEKPSGTVPLPKFEFSEPNYPTLGPNYKPDLNFRFPDGITRREIEHLNKSAKPAISEAERNRLVKRSKSRTPSILEPRSDNATE
jgi:hypothetical protein